MRQISSLTTPVAIVLAVGALFVAGGCKTSSGWRFLRHGPSGKVTTKVVVRTVPAGAEVSVNGKFQGVAPVEIPIRYIYATKIYERKEYVPYPRFEESELKHYEKNEFRIGAYMVGYLKAEQTVKLKGEETIEIAIELRKRPE